MVTDPVVPATDPAPASDPAADTGSAPAASTGSTASTTAAQTPVAHTAAVTANPASAPVEASNAKSLAYTGADVEPLAMLGAGLLAAGGLFLVAARRRKGSN